jgi:hypothetical protein
MKAAELLAKQQLAMEQKKQLEPALDTLPQEPTENQ